MKILLTHGYFLEGDAREQRLMKPYPPLGILYLAAYLGERDVPADVFDTTFSTAARLEAHLVETQPDVVGIYVNLMTKLAVLRLMRFIRAELPHTRIVLGGPEVTHHADQFLAHGADVVVIGEGEETMYALVQAWSSGTPLDAVAGIVFRAPDGTPVRTAPRSLLRSLDELPVPRREAIDLAPYLQAWRDRHGQNAVSVSTMRGCPYSCRWCSRAVYGESYRRRSPRLVADEIELVSRRYHPDALWFVDDVFTINHRWLEELTVELERRGLRIPYECITRADRLNERAVALLKRSGCFRVWIGAESGSQKILDAMDRRVTVEQVRTTIQMAKRAGIETGTFIMIGYPGETEADIDATIEHLKQADPDQFTITVAYPIKGTPYYEEVEEDIVDPRSWAVTTDRDLILRRPRSPLYYQLAVARVVNEVRSFQLARRAGRPSLAAVKHRAKALAARAGMRAEPMLRALAGRLTLGGSQPPRDGASAAEPPAPHADLPRPAVSASSPAAPASGRRLPVVATAPTAKHPG
jgi:radical SAM superfamily enzyme YgiQ (UPF0313 family)